MGMLHTLNLVGMWREGKERDIDGKGDIHIDEEGERERKREQKLVGRWWTETMQMSGSAGSRETRTGRRDLPSPLRSLPALRLCVRSE